MSCRLECRLAERNDETFRLVFDVKDLRRFVAGTGLGCGEPDELSLNDYLGTLPRTPASADIWESSRFVLDLAASALKTAGRLAQATCEPFAGMIEFGLAKNLARIVSVTDLRLEQTLRHASWQLLRIGRLIGETDAVAVELANLSL